MKDATGAALVIAALAVAVVGVAVHQQPAQPDWPCITDTECEALDYGVGHFAGIKVPAGFTFGE